MGFFTPIVAIAIRDLRAEFAGRRWGLPLIAGLLLVPASLLRSPGPSVSSIPVRGDVPESVAALDGVRVDNASPFFTGFRTIEGQTIVYTYALPTPVREALDGSTPVIRAEAVGSPFQFPKRSLLFALVSASTLTGAVSNSVGGERARNTLLALLSAAVTRRQIVAGKWLAWSAFGSLGALLAGLLTVLAGRQAAGPWLLALPVVPALTTALGLYLVRRTEDVIAGTSVSLRLLPAVIGATGMAAWALATWNPPLGAVVPLGGALMAAGDLWNGSWTATALAVLSSMAATLALLWATARDLEETPNPSDSLAPKAGRALPDGLLTGGIWFAVLPGPVLWGWAGNAAMTEALTPDRGLAAAIAMLAMLGGVRSVRTPDPKGRPLWWHPGALPIAVAGGLVFALAQSAPGFQPEHPWIGEAARRLSVGLTPPMPFLIPLILVQEWWFRGWMQRRAGWLPTALVWTLVVSPFNPIAGLVGGLALGFAGRWGLGAALLAHGIGAAFSI